MAVLLLVLACAKGSTPVSESAPALHFVVLGSSTAFGVGASSPDTGWVELYRVHLAGEGHTLTNLAVPGFTTWNVLPTGTETKPFHPEVDEAHNVTAALAEDPDALLVNLPSNDTVLAFSAADQLANYAVLVEVAGSVPIWFTTPQPRELSEKEVAVQREVMAGVNELYADRVLDFWTGVAADDGSILAALDSGDGIHVNDAGHAIFYDRAVALQIPSELAP